MKSCSVAVMALLLVFAGTAQADGNNWYAGIGAGNARFENTGSKLQYPGATASYDDDYSDTAYKLFAGYRFNPNFALEGSYTKLGDIRSSLVVTAPIVGSVISDSHGDGWGLDAVGILPLQSSLALFGKLGGFSSTTETHLSTTGAAFLAAGVPADRKRSEFNWKWGAGLMYDINQTLALRAEWEHYHQIGNTGCGDCTGEGNIDAYTLGLAMKF